MKKCQALSILLDHKAMNISFMLYAVFLNMPVLEHLLEFQETMISLCAVLKES